MTDFLVWYPAVGSTVEGMSRAVSWLAGLFLSSAALAACGNAPDGAASAQGGAGAGGSPAAGTGAGTAGMGGAPSAGQPGNAGGGVGGLGVGGVAGSAGSGPPFDASQLSVTGTSGPSLCKLSADRRTLLVTVTNQGTTPIGATSVRVSTDTTTYELRVDSPALDPGKSAELKFDRGPLAGFRPAWNFSVVIDPDAKHGAAHSALTGSCADLRSRAAAGMVPLLARYDMPTGLWDKTDWWTGANMLEISIDYMRETGDPAYADVIENTFLKNQSKNFLNDYYDDEGWWSLAWIKAYDLTHTRKYLDMAKTIFKDMTGAWSSDCNGGLFWSKMRSYKNAIPNELFLTIAVRLHQRTPGDAGAGSFLDWAQRDWAWFQSSGMIGTDNLIADGTVLSTCKPTGAKYSYNQGVILGALADLSQATGDPAPLLAAETIAHAAMSKMVDKNGVFIETACDPKCGDGDGEQFKGVFARNLAHLYVQSSRPEYQAFLIKQSDAIWTNDRSAKDEFGILWQGPFDKLTSSRQSSALDALNGALITAEQNLALHGTFSGSTACSAAEAADKAGDGSSRWNSRWCSPGASGQTLTVDLGAARYVTGFVVRHAGAGGESSTLDTRDFEIQLSTDGVSFAPAVTVTGNTADVTRHPIPAQTARYARLHVSAAQTATAAPSARIYELEVLGAGL